ncbi:XdhC family protein [Blautia faecis]|uniref:XdhC family protein n=1 Tax=Blautia faecis TaxID=871665 RepID=UPI001D075958|nr:XdhC/CoxI family protein [Blautia faecis]MCB6581272.1 XdhC family protein [Blautia faecis]MCB7294459.1 XdhC family protein [Blautia faecis]
MYNKIYQILDEKGRAKTGIFLDGLYMGKKCILKPETVIREENCGEAAEKKSGVQLIPEKTEDASIWDNYLNILSETKETKVTEADGHRLFVEDYRKNPRLVIFGGGHVSQPTAHLGKMLGFHVTIMDDREYFVTKERFPEADQLVYGDFKELDKYITPYDNTYYVILTRGHIGDADCLRRLLHRPYEYLGMIGSKNKVRITRENLLKEGYTLEQLDEVHAPIGIPLGGQLPEEIAVSIMAEIIKVKNQHYSAYCDEKVETAVLEGRHGVMVTIAEKSGSSPRGVGSKMFVEPSGHITGSIGGGKVEYEAISHCKEVKEKEVKHYALTADGQDSLGMICGGQVTVVFERV